MTNYKKKKSHFEVSIIGSGIAGITTAFHLSEKGYKVNLIDPKINSNINNLKPQNGTQASLGVLMGNIYKRSKGRSFILRNKSMQLWKKWLIKINNLDSNLLFQKPLIKLANSEKEYEAMQSLVKDKGKFNIKLLDKNSLIFWSSIFEQQLIGGLISNEDGRIDPIRLMKAMMHSIDHMNIKKINDKAIRLKMNHGLLEKNWKIYLEKNEPINQDFIIICCALSSHELLKPLGHKISLEPILGQIVELELEKENNIWHKWPAVLNFQSINFIHHDPSHIYMGATIEPIDPVRYLSNWSSGTLGCAVALAAATAGHKVTVLHGALTKTPQKHPRDAQGRPKPAQG